MHALTTALLLLLASPADDPAPAPSFEQVTLDGKVIPLTRALSNLSLPADPGPIADQYVLWTSDSQIIPLLSNAAGRAFFTDARLRDRPARITGRRHRGLPYLEPVAIQVQDSDSTWRTPEYFCDVCTISTRFDQICPCCQGPLVFRFRPED